MEINQRLVQGVGMNWSMIDQFHRMDMSLKENLYIASEKNLIELKNKDYLTY